MFYFVPIFYSYDNVPKKFTEIVHYNPVAAMILALRNILWDRIEPGLPLIAKLTFCSLLSFVAGFLLFRRLKAGFFDHM
jgi:lipopolysaccharide transport system permease protein